MVTSVAKGTAGSVMAEEGGELIATLVTYIFAGIAGIWFVYRREYRLSLSETPRLPMPLFVGVLLFFGSLVLGSIGAFFGMSHGEPESIGQLAWISGCALVAQVPIVFVYAMFVKPPALQRSFRVVAISFFVFAPLALATSGIAHTVFVGFGIEDPNTLGHETLQLLENSVFSTATLIVVLCATIGAGIVEEIVFRGLVLPSVPLLMRGMSLWGAILVTSVIFSSMHIGAVPASSLIGLAVLSIGLCWARVKSGGVLAPIVVHILFNTLNIAFVL